MSGVESSNARIAIVGAGSVGLVAATLLRQRGIAVDVFDDGDGPCSLPQAHVINTRTSEILDEIGAFGALRAVAAPLEKVRSIAWVESLSGRRFGKLDLIKDEQALATRMAASAVHPLNVGQNDFERVVGERLAECGGTVRYHHRVVGAAAKGSRAIIQVEDADKKISEYEYDYVLACDGAGSTIRSALGVNLLGPRSLARYASAYFTADLSHLMADITGPVTFVGGPDARGVIIGFDLDKVWAFMCVMPPDTSSADFGPDVMRELIHRALGDRSVRVDLIGVGTWNMSAQVADAFRSGPFFLVGDSAHRFPPTGGLGLNTGVQDAHNLAWKLAFVLDGRAGPGLLDSYSDERMPVAAANCEHSMANAMKMADVDQVLGVSFLAPVDPAVVNAPERAPAMLDIDGPGEAASERRRAVADILEQQRPHFDSLRHEIGFLYGHVQVFAGTHSDPASSIWAGGRLPHAVIPSSAGPVGSHALCRNGGFALIAGAAVDLARLPALPSCVILHQLPGEGGDAPLVEPDGLVLVRPDGHVAWCGGACEAAAMSDALSKLLDSDIRVPV